MSLRVFFASPAKRTRWEVLQLHVDAPVTPELDIKQRVQGKLSKEAGLETLCGILANFYAFCRPKEGTVPLVILEGVWVFNFLFPGPDAGKDPLCQFFAAPFGLGTCLAERSMCSVLEACVLPLHTKLGVLVLPEQGHHLLHEGRVQSAINLFRSNYDRPLHQPNKFLHVHLPPHPTADELKKQLGWRPPIPVASAPNDFFRTAFFGGPGRACLSLGRVALAGAGTPKLTVDRFLVSEKMEQEEATAFVHSDVERVFPRILQLQGGLSCFFGGPLVKELRVGCLDARGEYSGDPNPDVVYYKSDWLGPVGEHTLVRTLQHELHVRCLPLPETEPSLQELREGTRVMIEEGALVGLCSIFDLPFTTTLKPLQRFTRLLLAESYFSRGSGHALARALLSSKPTSRKDHGGGTIESLGFHQNKRRKIAVEAPDHPPAEDEWGEEEEKEEEEEEEREKEEEEEAASPAPLHIYSNVIELDFSSFYPSIAIMERLSFPGDTQGLFHRVLSDLLKKRREGEEEYSEGFIQSLKLVANIGYGWMSHHFPEVGCLMPGKGKEILGRASSLAKDMGLVVVAKATDSLFIHLPHGDDDTWEKLPELLNDALVSEFGPLCPRLTFKEKTPFLVLGTNKTFRMHAWPKRPSATKFSSALVDKGNYTPFAKLIFKRVGMFLAALLGECADRDEEIRHRFFSLVKSCLISADQLLFDLEKNRKWDQLQLRQGFKWKTLTALDQPKKTGRSNMDLAIKHALLRGDPNVGHLALQIAHLKPREHEPGLATLIDANLLGGSTHRLDHDTLYEKEIVTPLLSAFGHLLDPEKLRATIHELLHPEHK